MKNDISNTIDLDSILQPQQEVVKEVVTQTNEPIVVDWDEILTEWSYRCPKGYPTVVDGKFVDREEVEILNEIMEERFATTMPLPEAKPEAKANKPAPKKSKAVLKPEAFAKWWNSDMADANKRTKFFELIPIVQALQPNKPVTVQSLLSTISKHSNLDWGEIDFITKPLEKFIKAKDTVTYLDDYYFAGKSEESPIPKTGGMVSIYNNLPINSFIWSKVKSFYKLVNESKSEKGSENKVFTADVILFWGVDNPINSSGEIESTLKAKIQKAIDNPKMAKGSTSVVDLGGDQFMACVSLKAGHGRMGKITTYMNNFVQLSPDEVDDTIPEGFFGDLGSTTLRSSGAFVDNLKSVANAIGGKIAKAWNSIKEFFANLVTDAEEGRDKAVADADSISDKLSEFLEIVQDADPTFDLNETLQEGDDGLITCNSCMQQKVKDMKTFMNKFLDGTALNEFEAKIKELSAQPGFVYKFEKLDVKVAKVKEAIQLTKKVVAKIEKAKVKTTQAGSKKIKCELLDLELNKSELKNIFFINANQNAITAITNMLNHVLPKGVTKPAKAMEAFLELAVDLNAQSVFGKSGNLPLVKFTGIATPQQLGTKQDYKTKLLNVNKQYTSKLTKQKLPVIGLKITPSAGKKSESPYYYNVVLYTLYTINANEAGEVSPQSFSYALIAFNANRGSQFSFVVEANKEESGDKVMKAFT
jgi:hypothetical protein